MRMRDSEQIIEVEKDRLLATLKQNRDSHREEFLRAQDVFRRRVIEAFESRLADARDGKKVRLFISMPEPEDHTLDYEAAIQMVEWSIGDTVTVTQGDFRRFVLNQWEWEQSYVANTMSYLAE